MTDRPPALTIGRRFCGPPTSGNGGYTAGRLAAFLGGGTPVQVTLRRPPPLETEMAVAVSGTGAVATHDGDVVAEAVAARLDVDPVEPVSYGRAAEAARGYRGAQAHPFPTCFACGTTRGAPDGLALRPGPLPDRPQTTAAPWIPDAADGDPDGRMPVAFVWAVLDCPGGWTVDLVGRPSVLGRMTAAVDELPIAGDRCVVMGRLLGTEGRKAYTATTLYDGDARVLARAHAVWFEVDPAAFGSPAENPPTGG